MRKERDRREERKKEYRRKAEIRKKITMLIIHFDDVFLLGFDAV